MSKRTDFVVSNPALSHPVHGMSRTPTYMCWKAMNERCSVGPSHRNHKNYGGRGSEHGERGASIARRLAVSPQSVSKVLANQQWKMADLVA